MRILALPALAALAFAGCSGNEIVGLHIAMRDDGSALITTRALSATTAPNAVEALLPGVTFTARATLAFSQGTVRSLQDFKFADDSLKVTSRLDDEFPGLRLRVQRGPGVGWAHALVPDLATRRSLARIYDPTRVADPTGRPDARPREVGDVLRLEITAPKNVVSSMVQPTGRGIEAGREGKRAFLLIPASTALENGDELVWDITWADVK